jgi:hypothetical protein
MVGMTLTPVRVLATLDLDASGHSPILPDPLGRFVRWAIAIRHHQVDDAVHLSAWLTLPAFPAIVDSGEGETALSTLWADRLFPPDYKAQLLPDFENGNLRVNPLEIG